MMKTFSVGVLTDTLTKSSSGAITGKIHVKADDFVFPEYEWDDFVVITDEYLSEGEFLPKAVIGGVLFAAELVLKMCQEKDWTSPEITSLIETCSALGYLDIKRQ